jgi:hypothetical protein
MSAADAFYFALGIAAGVALFWVLVSTSTHKRCALAIVFGVVAFAFALPTMGKGLTWALNYFISMLI